VLIEDIKAVNNLDEILAVDHIDVYHVAPSDLAQSMGHIGDDQHPDVQRTINESIAKIIAAGKTANDLGIDLTALAGASAVPVTTAGPGVGVHRSWPWGGRSEAGRGPSGSSSSAAASCSGPSEGC